MKAPLTIYKENEKYYNIFTNKNILEDCTDRSGFYNEKILK